MEKCLFCDIVSGKEPSVKVWEDGDFLVIRNKYPIAPVHVLIMPKKHVSKKEMAEDSGSTGDDFWGKIMGAVFATIRELGLNKTGYKLVNNGAGYNHFDHEHIHILGGTKGEPGGRT